MSKDTRDVIVIATGFIFGAWLYFLYSEGGWGLMLTDWWKGLIVSVLFLTVVFIWSKIAK